MDIEELKLFRHLAESLHFGRTSRARHVTPSALTRTIQRLEAEVGERLFDRDKRSVRLTKAGEALRQYAEETITRWQELKNSLADDTALHGDISLYCSVTAAYSILPGILGRFRKACPEVQIKLQTGDAAQGLAKLRNGEVEVIIDALPDKQADGLEFRPLTETPLVFIASLAFPETVIYEGTEIITDHGGVSRKSNNHRTSGHRVPQVAAHPEGISFARADKLPSSAISGLAMRTFVREPVRSPQDVVPCDRLPEIDWRKTPVIVAEQGLGRERLDRWFAAKKILPNIYAQVAGNEAIIAMVSLGCGVGVVPLLVLEKSPLQDQITVLAISPALAPFSLGVCTVKKNLRNPKIQAFWEIAGAR